MKGKKYPLFLILEAGALLCVRGLTNIKFSGIFDLLALPVTKLAEVLSFLSERDKTGNALALGLYALVSCIPLFYLLFRIGAKRFSRSDLLLPVISASLFRLIYLLVNPWKIGQAGLGEKSAELVSFSFWAILTGYLIIRFAGYVKKEVEGKNERLLANALKATGAVFVFALCSFQIKESDLVLITVTAFLSTAVPYVFSLATVLSALSLLKSFTEDRYSQETEHKARALSRLCITGVSVSVLLTVLLNLLQLVFISSLSDISFNVSIPLFSLSFILLTLVLSDLLRDTREIKQDNDSII